MLLMRLGSDKRRAAFLESLIPSSLKGFARCPCKVVGACSSVAAYYMFISICNELGCSVNDAAQKLEREVSGRH